MIEVLLLEENSDDAEFIIHNLHEANPDVYVECVSETKDVLDFVFCTGKFASRTTQQAPKLLLLDITSSQEDGLALLRILKSYARTRLLPVVVLLDAPSNNILFKVANSCIIKTPNRAQLGRAIKIIGHYWLMVNSSVDNFDMQDEQLNAEP